MVLPREFVVFDTETTGTPPSGRLVEIGAVKVRGHTVVERFESLVFPECPIPQEVIQVHGITDAEVAQSPTAEQIVPDFLAWIGGAPVVAHNAPFDAAILASECARLGIPVPRNRVLCTLAASRKLLKKRRSHSLGSLVEDLGIRADRRHRATDDAEQALDLLWHLVEVGGREFNAGTLGRRGSLHDYVPDDPELPHSRRLLSEAAVGGDAVDLHYVMRDHRVVPLRVSPRFFYRRRGTVFMEALCHLSGFYKSYRLDRIAAAHPSPDAPPMAVRRNLAAGGWR